MIDFVAEIVAGIVELLFDLLIDPWIGRLRRKTKTEEKK